MIWVVVAVLIGLALGGGVVLVLARRDSLHSAHRRVAERKSAPTKPVAPPVQVARSHDKPPAVDRPLDSPEPLRKAVSPKPVAPSVRVERSDDRAARADRSADFPDAVVKAAWRRQGGLCAQCGRLLIWANRDRDSGTGAWQKHHRIPIDQGGSSDLKNCVLFCSGVANCHFNIGHGGIGWNHYSPLEDSGLLYLRYGAEKVTTTVPQTGTRSSLIREVFGILTPGRAKTKSASKPKANRSRRSLQPEDDYEGVL
jgi:5-methylcytosine-specific restriction endonuclease McrA